MQDQKPFALGARDAVKQLLGSPRLTRNERAPGSVGNLKCLITRPAIADDDFADEALLHPINQRRERTRQMPRAIQRRDDYRNGSRHARQSRQVSRVM